MAQYVYTLNRVSKVVPPKRQILKDISLSFFPGAKIGVLGLNGSGKSTLLKIMAGIDKDIEGEAIPMPGLDVGYLPQEPQLNPDNTVRQEVELAMGFPPTHDVTAKLAPSLPSHVQVLNGQVIAKVRQVAPTLFFNYKFGDPGSTWRPFVGAGINYTKFDKRESTAAGNQLNGGPTDIRLSDSWGLAAQAGVSYRLNDQWSLNAAVATARVKTHLTATTAGQARKIDIRFRPTVITLSAGYVF